MLLRKRQNVAFVRIHRTRRMPERLFVTGKIRFTMVPRAVADAARSMARFDDVRAVVYEAVPKRIKTDAAGIIREIGQAIEKGLQRPPLSVTGLPPEEETASQSGKSSADRAAATVG
jgi:hypothetical protein